MANYTIDKIKYGNDTYIIKDSNASTTDNKVSLTADSTNEFLPVTFKKGTTNPAGIYYNDNIKVNPSTGTINATAAKFVNLGADKGIFNKLIATTADIENLDVNNLTATNATVVGMLDVQGDLHTNSWTNANMANIGGSFYISPTIAPTDGSTTITINRVSATSWTIQLIGTFATDFIKSGTSTTGVNWPANSLVLVTGNVTLNNMVYPLGTLKGTLSSAVTASAASTSKTITITGVVDGQGGNTPYVLQELYELNGNANLTTKAFTNGKISLYQLGSFPIGIQLSSMGIDANSMIEIYGGISTDPTVRVGHLAGLSSFNVNNKTTVTPTGWGIYTDNGFFKGVIAATSGIIGGFDIGQTDLHNGTLGAANSVWMSTGTSGSASIGGSSSINNWAFTASNQFGVTQTGELWANLAHIKGSIDATSFQARDGSGNIRAVVDSNGLTVKDAAGNMVAAFSGSGVSFSSSVSQKIGNNTNYIEFNPTTNRINIIGSGVYFGSTPIDDVATIDKIDTAINNIEVGGRNLVEKSNNGSTYTWMQNKGAFIKTVDDLGATFTITTLPEANSWGVLTENGQSNVVQKIEAGVQYKVSFDLRTSVSISNLLIAASVRKTDGSKPFTEGTTISLNTVADTWHHIVASTKAVATLPDLDNQRLYISMPKLKEQLGSFSIKNIKLERGNKATDWTPAPEDVQAEIDAKKSTHTLIAYPSATATTQYTATYASILGWSTEGRTGLNAWLQSVDGIKVGDTVRLAFLVSDMNNATVYIIGEVTDIQQTTGKPLIKFTAHGLDTTVIDGGNILTNSIGANQIKANSIGAKHLVVSDNTNLVLANEYYADSLPTNIPSDYQPVISNGALTKKVATQAYLMVTNYIANRFKQNDQLYYEFYGKSDAAGSITLAVWGYTGAEPNHTYAGWDAKTISFTTTEQLYSGTITLTNACWNTATNYIIGFNDSRSTKSQIHIRKLIVRRKSAGELIVDGSITADKIAANAVTIGKIPSTTQSELIKNTQKLYSYTVDLSVSTYDQNTWYPVLIGPAAKNDAYVLFQCCLVDGGGTPSWSSHYSKHWACDVKAHYAPSTWGWKSDTSSYIESYIFGQTSTNPIVLSNALSNTAKLVVYLRGGGIYPIQTNISTAPSIKTSSYTESSQTVAPTTTQPVNTSNFVISRRESDTKTNDAAKTATTYITAIDNNGIKVHAANNPNNNYSKIDAEGLEVYKDSESVAKFGQLTRIGREVTSRVELDENSISLITDNGLDALRSETSGASVSGLTPFVKYGKDTYNIPSNNSRTLTLAELDGISTGGEFQIVFVESLYYWIKWVSTTHNNNVASRKAFPIYKLTPVSFNKGTAATKQVAIEMTTDIKPVAQNSVGVKKTKTYYSVEVKYTPPNTIYIKTPAYKDVLKSHTSTVKLKTGETATVGVIEATNSFVLYELDIWTTVYLPKTQINGRAYLGMTSDSEIPDPWDSELAGLIDTLGWKMACLEED